MLEKASGKESEGREKGCFPPAAAVETQAEAGENGEARPRPFPCPRGWSIAREDWPKASPEAQARGAHARPRPPPSSPPSPSFPSPPLSSAPSLRCGGRKNPFRPARRVQIDSHSGRKKRPRTRIRPTALPGATEVARSPTESPRPAQPSDPRPAAAA
nr:uncharacterized protein LOC103351851 [Oryctolagus cuniculus]